MAYKQLDYLTRCKINGLWRAGFNQTKIAKELHYCPVNVLPALGGHPFRILRKF